MLTPNRQAAAAIDALSLTTPTKGSKLPALNLIDDERLSKSPASLVDEVEHHDAELEELRKKWVGEIELPEREYIHRGRVATRCAHMTV